MVDQNAKRVERLSNETNYSLNIDTYRAYMAEVEKESDMYKDIFKKHEALSIYTMEADKAEFEKDEIQKEKIAKWHESIQKDPYVEEAINVLADLK